MKIEFAADASQWYKLASFWFLVAAGISPELFALAVQHNLITADEIPAFFARIINFIGFAGAAGRLIKQKSVEAGIAAKAAL